MLSKDAPLRVCWSKIRLPCVQSEWLVEHMTAIAALQLKDDDYSGPNTQAVQHLVTDCLKSHSSTLKSLELSGVLDEDSLSQVLPALEFPNLLHLRLYNCWSPILCTSKLQTLHVTVGVQSLSMKDIYRILSCTPLLSSCIFEVTDGSGTFHKLPLADDDSPLRLPHLHTLKIRVFPITHFEWFYDRTVPIHS